MLETEKNQGISCYRGIMLLVLVGALFVVSAPSQSYAISQQRTVATFADPALGGDTPLFTVDFGSLTEPGSLSGGWGDDQVGLDLEIVWTGITYPNAFFVFDTIECNGDITGASTEAGVIEFYKDGDDPDQVVEALLKLEFGSAHVSLGGVYAHSIFVDNVRISGTGIPDRLDLEEFSFGFANKEPLDGGWNDGFSATAAFTSSAVKWIPEPISFGLLSLGSLVLLRAGRRPVARR